MCSGPRPVRGVVGPAERLAVDGNQAGRAGPVGLQGTGNPVPEAPLKGLRLEGDEHPADAVARGDAVREREEPVEPRPAVRGPPVDGRRAVGPAHQAAHRDHHDVDEPVLTVAGVTRVGQGPEVGPDGFDVHDSGRHGHTRRWTGNAIA